MEKKVAAIAPDAGIAPLPTAVVPPAKASEPPVAAGPDPNDMRLVIELDQGSGSYVYKTVNRLTGEVLKQIPRAEVLKLHHGPGYHAGTVFKTEV